MPGMPLINAARLRLLSGREAEKGTLLFKAAGYGNAPYLAFRDSREQALQPYLLRLAKDQRSGFEAAVAVMNDGPWLAIDRWELRVDTDTAFMGTNGFPQAGDAFISNGVPGFVGRMNHATVYVSAIGEMLPEPNWGSGWVGFRRWAIFTDGSHSGDEIRMLGNDRDE